MIASVLRLNIPGLKSGASYSGAEARGLLFPDAELVEYLVEYFFRQRLAGDFAQAGKGEGVGVALDLREYGAARDA